MFRLGELSDILNGQKAQVGLVVLQGGHGGHGGNHDARNEPAEKGAVDSCATVLREMFVGSSHLGFR